MKKLFIYAAVLVSMVAFAEKVSVPAEGEKLCCEGCKKIEKKMPPKPEVNREKFREMREKRAKEMSEKCAKEGIITPRAAIAAALAHAKLDRKDVRRIECELEREDGRVVYDVEFKKGRYEYDYDIDARTGAVLKQKYELD